MADTKKPASAKTPAKKASAKKASAPTDGLQKPARKRAPAKDPKGGLTAEGRKQFAETEGAHLRPGVQGPADTPEKMKRKGSFLRRHFANPQGPMERDGEPTRLALSAQAWGEPLPKTDADAEKLAEKGHALLEQYHQEEEGKQGKPRKRAAGGNARKKRGASAKTAPGS